MKVIIADDDPAMLTRLKDSISELDPKHSTIELCGEGVNGEQLIEKVEQQTHIDLVISDIRMPVMDGLSALVYLKAKYHKMKIVMLSSESAASMMLSGEKHEEAGGELSKKLQMLDQVATRVRKKETAEGKINSILTGCEKLQLDPIEIAKYYGADGYIRKPVSTGKLGQFLDELQSSSEFINIKIA